MVKTYLCPSCGAAMLFDPESQRLTCPNCGSSMTGEEAEKITEGKETEGSYNDEDYETGTDDDRIDCKVYNCPSCGAEILTDKYTTATICSFCGNPGLMEDRIEGILRPSYVIPFSIAKNNAVDIFKKWTGRGLLTPDDFKSQNTIEKMTGMYVPYWLYDYDMHVDMAAHCRRTTRTVKRDKEYIYTHNYDVVRSADARYERVPADASKKLDDDMMDLLEPFNYTTMLEFNDSYLSGYQSERYSVGSEELEEKIKGRVSRYAENSVRNSIAGYESVNIYSKNIRGRKTAAKYALLPVWILNYRYLGKNYMTVINGQTGKLVGKLPISRAKTALSFGISTLLVFIIMSIVSFIML